jgi:hypothetical protein
VSTHGVRARSSRNTDPIQAHEIQSPGIVRGFLFGGRVVDVRFGSKADMTPMNCDVCFTPNNGHSRVWSECRLSARSGHLDFLAFDF